MAHQIYKLEDWLQDRTGPTSGVKLSLSQFLQPWWAKYQGGQIPGLSERQGELTASINHGRWVVECPACSGAIMASIESPYFICTGCGSVDNDGKWYDVVFPPEAQRREIETLLTKRPARHPLLAATRNWTPGEDVKLLRAENKRLGVPR